MSKKRPLKKPTSNPTIDNIDLNNAKISFKQAFLQSPIVWLLVKPDTGAIIDANVAASKFYGYLITELKTMKICDISVSSATETKAFLILTNNNISRPHSCQHKLKNGHLRYVNVYSGPFKTGKDLLISLIIIDVTARRKAKEKVKRSQQRLSSIIDGAKAGIWELDITKRTIFCDKHFLAMLGYEENEVNNNQINWQDFYHPDDLIRIKKTVKNYLTGITDRYEGEFRMKHKDGSYCWFFCAGKVLYNDTKTPIRWIGLSFDITAKKKVQIILETKRRSQMLNDILSGIRCVDEDNKLYAKSIGLDVSQPLLCCVISFDKPVPTVLNDEIIAELNSSKRLITWGYRGKIGAIYQVKQIKKNHKFAGKLIAQSLQKKIKTNYPSLSPTIGIGETQQEISGLKKSFQQAWEAAHVAQCDPSNKNIINFLDLGILQLLIKQTDKTDTPEFIRKTVGKLIQYDQEKGTDYVDTLAAILQKSNLKEVAQLLFLHYNTIVFRKKRIETILGLSINDFETKLTLATAIKLYKLHSLE